MTVADPITLVGSTLANKYILESLVQVETFSVVYRGSARASTSPRAALAVRVFTSLAALPADQRKAVYLEFVRDAHTLGELAPLLPAVYPTRDVGTIAIPAGMLEEAELANEWVPYIVLEWPVGATLRQRMADAPCSQIGDSQIGEAPPDLTAHIMRLEPVAVALAIAHEHDVVHGGVTPDHVILVEDEAGAERMMLLDFGVAKLLRARAGEAAVDARDDVAALAELVLDWLAVACGIAAEGNTPRARGIQVDDAVEAVFARALAPSHGDRFATVGELWSALRAALNLPMLRALTATVPPEDGNARASRSLQPYSHTTPPLLLGSGKSARFLIASMSIAVVAGIGAFTFSRARSSSLATAPEAAAPELTMGSAASPPLAKALAPCPNDMVRVDGRSFVMGSDASLEVERPAHPVSITPFCIDRLEVTTQDFRTCSERADCKRAGRTNTWPSITDRDHIIFDPLCNARDPDDKAKHPINCVTWEQAATYCGTVGKRLPTESEWELAARGTDGRIYPWGSDAPSAQLLNACGKECVAWEKKNRLDDGTLHDGDDQWLHTAPVGSFPHGASPYGALDMAGNVWEWVEDWYAAYPAGDSIDPKGPASGDKRVMRGGAWNAVHPPWVRATFRFAAEPSLRSHAVGFRCAKSQ